MTPEQRAVLRATPASPQTAISSWTIAARTGLSIPETQSWLDALKAADLVERIDARRATYWGRTMIGDREAKR